MKPILDVATWLQSFGAIGSFVLLVIKATLVLLLARLVLAAFPKASAAARHIALTSALGGVLVLPLLMFAVPSWTVAVLPNPAVHSQRAIGTTGDEDAAPTALEAAITVARATGVVAQERITAMSQLLQTVKNSWQGLLLMAILGLSFVFLFRMVAGIIGVGMVARRAAPVTDDDALRELDAACDHLQLEREIRLLRSAEISVPIVWGVQHPVLMLPTASSTWSMERLRVVVLHELAHVKRWDAITLLMTRAAVAVFWFHPLMWMLERSARNECERACDDLVLASGTRPSDYAEHLLSIARALPHTDPFRSVTLAMSRRSQLEGRLLSILESRARRGRISTRTMTTAAGLALMLLVPLASLRLGAAPPNSPPKDSPAPQGVVEIGPSVAAKVMGSPEMILAAIERFKKKQEKAPADGSEWYGHAHKLYQADRYQEAIEAFRKSADLGHRVAVSRYNIACSYALMGDAENAVRALEDAIRSGWDDFDHMAEDSDFDPIRSSARFQQLLASHAEGAASRHDHRIEDALDEYDALRAAASGDGGEWFSVGLDLLRLRKLDESIEAFRNALRLDTKSSAALYNIACAYSLKGDARAAAEHLRQAVENGFEDVEKLKNDPDLRHVRGRIDLGELTQLASDLRLHSGWRGKMWFFGNAEQDAWRDMVPHYRAMTRKHPRLGRTWFNLGYAELQAGENLASAASFQKALELGYRPGASTYNTACAFARGGQRDAAFTWLEKAHAIGFNLHDYLHDDDDLESLHDDPRWSRLEQRVMKHHQSHHSESHEMD